MKSEIKIKLNEITPEGYDLEDYLDAAYIGLTSADPLYFIAPVVVTGRLYKVKESIIANLTASSRFASFCCRTLEPVRRDWSARITLDFPVDPLKQVIDIADEVRQEVIINIPLRVLSETEMAKDARGEPSLFEADDEPGDGDGPEKDTYRPFDGLDLNG
jgi:uncharacterized metal-binding protein YceD (DUF177 family)